MADSFTSIQFCNACFNFAELPFLRAYLGIDSNGKCMGHVYSLVYMFTPDSFAW